jgi:hypothetical protein
LDGLLSELQDKESAVTVAFYGFQKAPAIQQFDSTSGWPGWFDRRVKPLLDLGVREFHLHNPFGMYLIKSRLKPNGDPIMMHIDQFELARCHPLPWLANASEFTRVVSSIHSRGGKVFAYVGSPLAIPFLPTVRQLRSFVHCYPSVFSVGHIFGQVKLWSALCSVAPGRCKSHYPSAFWQRFVRAHMQVLLDAQVDAIAFDHSNDFNAGDPMDQLVQNMLRGGMEVMIEAWPRAGRSYPPVSWILTERKYLQVKHLHPADLATIGSVSGRKIYRILPNHCSDDGSTELADISRDFSRYGVAYDTTQDVIDAVISEGHIPMVSWQQLLDGSLANPCP